MIYKDTIIFLIYKLLFLSEHQNNELTVFAIVALRNYLKIKHASSHSCERLPYFFSLFFEISQVSMNKLIANRYFYLSHFVILNSRFSFLYYLKTYCHKLKCKDTKFFLIKKQFLKHILEGIF